MNLQKIEEKAKKELLKDGYLKTFVIVPNPLNKEEIAILPIDFQDDEEKKKVQFALARAISEKKIKKYYFVAESFFLKIDKGNEKLLNTRPSEAKDRQEALVISEFTPTSTKTIMNVFVKEKGKIVFTERNVLAGKECTVDSSFNVFPHIPKMKMAEKMAEQFAGKFEKANHTQRKEILLQAMKGAGIIKTKEQEQMAMKYIGEELEDKFPSKPDYVG